MLKKANQTVQESLNWKLILKGIGFSYLITIPLFLIFALILSSTSYPEKLIMPAVSIITIISLIVAGSISTRNLKSRGWLNGAIVGFLYILILYIIGSIACGNFSITRYVWTMALIGVLAGAIGGILGINLHFKKYRR
jgi:putative membrane protein (TIGR04086 family)